MDNARIAAAHGVLYYLRAEREQDEQFPSQQLLYHQVDPWTLYGRRTTAHLRDRVQRRACGRFHLTTGDTVPEKGLWLQKAKEMTVKQGLCTARSAMHGSGR